MSQKSAIYSAARVRVLEKGLMDRDDIRRLADADDYDSAMRILSEFGYGTESAETSDIEQVLSGERKKVRALVDELTTKPEITNVFFMRYDMLNLKMLIKQKMQGIDVLGVSLENSGIIEPKLLALMVKQWDFSSLPSVMQKRLAELDEKLARERANISPQSISTAIDRMYFEYARGIAYPFTAEYFSAVCDFENVLTLIRMKKLGADAKSICELFMPFGDISENMLLSMLQCDTDEAMIKKLAENKSKVSIAICNALIDFSKLYNLEVARDDYTIELARRGKWDMETILPVISFYLAKEREEKLVRLIMTLKKSGVAPEKITERLREVYNG